MKKKRTGSLWATSTRMSFLRSRVNTPGNYCKQHDYMVLLNLKVQLVWQNSASTAIDLIFVNNLRTEFKNSEQVITPLFLPLRKEAPLKLSWSERSKILQALQQRTIYKGHCSAIPWSILEFFDDVNDASFQTFCLTARVYLNTKKYGLFCRLMWCQRTQLGLATGWI